MRADRLVAVLMLLQTRGRVTALEIAQELEVSERTARRDLDALAIAGIPVYSQPGRGGGWELLGGARTDLSGLTMDEARALFLVAGPDSSATPELKAALRKLVAALPEPFRAGAEAAADAVFIDPAAWGRNSSNREAITDTLDLLRRAIIDQRQVELVYSSRGADARPRPVHPLGLTTKGAVWYLVGLDADVLTTAGSDAARRVYRCDRIRGATRLETPAQRPADFDLAAAWEEIVTRVDELRATHRTTLLVDADAVGYFVGMFGRRVVSNHFGEPRSTIVLGTPAGEPRRIASELAGFGGSIEVIDPPDVRAELHRLGTDLAARHAGEGPLTGSAPGPHPSGGAG